jgi:hypothetical protein
MEFNSCKHGQARHGAPKLNAPQPEETDHPMASMAGAERRDRHEDLEIRRHQERLRQDAQDRHTATAQAQPKPQKADRDTATAGESSCS